MDKNYILRQLPRVDDLAALCLKNSTQLPQGIVLTCSREVLNNLREKISCGELSVVPSIDSIVEDVVALTQKACGFRLKRVINATGVVIHTNLGRSVLAKEVADHVADVASSYSTLEYDLPSGARGSRHVIVESLVCALTGAEAAFAVNNNAAAVMLALSGVCGGREVIVSRGELVEIGGAFRVPEIMSLSGAFLREVGTTNRTGISDYAAAVNENTAALLKVHTSNFQIVGFTEDTPITSLAELGREKQIPVLHDLGSGLINPIGGVAEMTAAESLKAGADIVCFSADKLLGGPQAGIIAGKKCYIDRLKKNQLARVVRLDKLSLAALEATLKMYLEGREAQIPTINYITQTPDQLKNKAKKLLKLLTQNTQTTQNGDRGYSAEIKECDGQVGGGSAPGEVLPSFVVEISAQDRSAAEIESGLRGFDTPIIARINKGKVLIDVRTVDESDFATVAAGLKRILV